MRGGWVTLVMSSVGIAGLNVAVVQCDTRVGLIPDRKANLSLK